MIGLSALWCPGASAQVGETLLIQPVAPEGYSLDGNVSVADRPRPYYDATGVYVGSFKVLPRMSTGGGVTSNTYLTPDNETSSVFLYSQPSVAINSDWSRHSLIVRANGQFRSFLGQSRRNENAWSVSTAGRVDITHAASIDASAASSLNLENRFSGEVTPVTAAIARYRRDTAFVRGQYRMGRIRALLTADYTDLRFRPLELVSGAVADQSARDRDVTRFTGELDYASSPSLTFFGQLGYGKTAFKRAPTNLVDSDSTGVRILGGVKVDLPGRARGTIGVGYTRRKYDRAGLGDTAGLSVDSKLELFPTQLMTITLNARRTLEDSQLLNSSAFWDNRLGLTVDHELLRNLILRSSVELARQNYITSNLDANGYRFSFGATRLSSRVLELQTSVSYSTRTPNRALNSSKFDELSAQVGVTVKL